MIIDPMLILGNGIVPLKRDAARAKMIRASMHKVGSIALFELSVEPGGYTNYKGQEELPLSDLAAKVNNYYIGLRDRGVLNE